MTYQPELSNQSCALPLAAVEERLAEGLLKAFAAGQHDFGKIAAMLQSDGVERPSGQSGEWTLETLEYELITINARQDAAYQAEGYKVTNPTLYVDHQKQEGFYKRLAEKS